VTPVLAGLLLAGAAFNILTWPFFLRRVAKDARARDADGRPTRFLIVHIVLVAIGLAFAVAFVVAAIAVLSVG
jgi:uncharacterized membrane protein